MRRSFTLRKARRLDSSCSRTSSTSDMIVIPAIDLLDGQVVRLEQGRREAVTVYSKDPVGIARQWAEAGASWLHVVDLNGAFDGTYINLPIAQRVIEACRVNVELSGGIRTNETLSQALGAGP